MDIKNILKNLHQLERKVLPLLKEGITQSDLIKNSSMKDAEVMRAISWLEGKRLVKIKEIKEEFVELTKKGLEVVEKGLPEKRFLAIIMDGKKTKDEILKKLSNEEFGVSIGKLKKLKAIEVFSIDSKTYFEITKEGLKLIKENKLEGIRKELLDGLNKSLIPISKLNLKQNEFLKDAIDRRLVNKVIKKDKIINLTKEIKELQKLANTEGVNTVDRLTTQMIRSGSFKDKDFREYEVDINFSNVDIGRRHPMIEANNILRDIFIEMGFCEMEGPMVESAFWNMDTMWIPQDHPARDEQDTFYLNGKAKLPQNLIKEVKRMHEVGLKRSHTDKGQFSEDVAARRLLRTHSTATTFRTLAKLGEELKKGKNIDGKYFYVANNFRNEAVDATHLAEFYQAEGFIIGDDLSLANLMGFVKEYYSKLGIDKIKFKPTFNPYTEPSMEAHYYDQKMGKWYALINSGIFRPETLKPLGLESKRIIAWGMGASRVATLLANKSSMREITGYTCDFDWLKNRPIMTRNIIR